MYDGGRHSIGVDYNFKVFSADAHFLEYNNIAIFAADKLEVSSFLKKNITSDSRFMVNFEIQIITF